MISLRIQPEMASSSLPELPIGVEICVNSSSLSEGFRHLDQALVKPRVLSYSATSIER